MPASDPSFKTWPIQIKAKWKHINIKPRQASPVMDFIVLRSFNNEGKVETYHHEIKKLPVSLAASDCRPTALCARERGDYAAAGKGVGGMAEATN